MSAAYGGMLSSPILATSLVVELARPKRPGFANTIVAALLSSTVAFALYFPIAGSTFLGIYAPPPFKYEDWQGIAFGLVGVALPLTLFTGTSQLTTVIHDGAVLGAGLIIAVVFAKILTFALCEATGFIGGPILVMLFIGGTAGIAAHLLIPGLPEGLAFATMFAAILGSLVAAPFTLIVPVALTARIGALQLAPVAVAVLTSYLAVSGSGALMALVRRGRKPARPASQAAGQPSQSAS